MKKLLFATIALMLIFTIGFGSYSAFAEETQEPPITSENPVIEEELDDTEETPQGEENAAETGKLKEQLAAAIAKLNEYTGEDNYFKNKILPYIISNGSSLLLVGAFVLRKYFKNKSKADAMEVMAASLQAEKENLTNLLTSTDVGKIQEAITKLLGGYIDKILLEVEEKFGGYMQTFASIKTTLEVEYSQLKNLVAAARQAWASKPEAATLLAESPEKSTLENQALVIESLKDYIRQLKGAEAEETLKAMGA